MVEAKSFGQWLRHRRRDLDLTQEQLARQVGCAPITVRKIEADQMRPSRQLAELLMERLRIAAEEREDLVRFARGGKAAECVSVTEPRDNLPHPISSFIGREREIADILRLLGASRLVTLTGAGGCGKSRLAIEAARRMLNLYPDGIWFVGFAPLSDPTLVHRTIASALRVREDPGRPLIETLCTYLRSKHLLLLFDNCEHLIGECAHTADTLLQACSQLRILATSREALEISGEEQYYVPGLSLPRPETDIPIEEATQSEAVRLFVSRAATVQPAFALTPVNSSLIAQICQCLDGMPLAIELAAARVKLLSVRHIAQHLDDRFSLLTGGSRTALPRHQTLRATIEWSHDLLPERTRVLFQRLSVFAGGFTPEAAQTVCSGEDLTTADVLAELSCLVDRSLVEVVPSGEEERYHLLETIRQYARERLRESGEESQVQDRYLRYFMDWVEQAEPKLRSPEQLTWWARMETEHDNIRGALDWSLSGGDAQCGLRLAGSAFWFWKFRSYWKEGLEWLKATLAGIPAGQRTPARARALAAAGNIAMEMYTDDPIDAWYEESLGIWRETSDQWWSSYTLILMGWRRILVNDATASKALFDESVALARRAQDEWLIGYSLRGLGAALQRVDVEIALPILEESLIHTRTAGDRFVLGEGLRQLGTAALGLGDYPRAASLAEESLDLFREIGDQECESESLIALVTASICQGQWHRARELCQKALRLGESIEYSSAVGCTLILSGCIAEAEGQLWHAAILLAAGESVLNSIGTSIAMWPWHLRVHERSMASVKAQLAKNEFDSAIAEGQAMTVEQAVKYALETHVDTPGES